MTDDDARAPEDNGAPRPGLPMHIFGQEEPDDSRPVCAVCHKPMKRAEGGSEAGEGSPIQGMKYFHADCLEKLSP